MKGAPARVKLQITAVIIDLTDITQLGQIALSLLTQISQPRRIAINISDKLRRILRVGVFWIGTKLKKGAAKVRLSLMN